MDYGTNFFLDESSLGLKLSLYPEFQLPMCPGTVLKVCVVGGGWVVGVETKFSVRLWPKPGLWPLASTWAKPNKRQFKSNVKELLEQNLISW